MSFPVLICDDSSLARRNVQRSLPQGFSDLVLEATNGAEAMSILEQQPIALLLLDLTMPVMDGVEVLEAIRARKLEVFVIVISGDIQPMMQQKVKALGALDFIKKPVDADKLKRVLEHFGLY